MNDIRNFDDLTGREVIFTWADGDRASREEWQSLYLVVEFFSLGNNGVWVTVGPPLGEKTHYVKMFPLSAVLGMQLNTSEADTAADLDNAGLPG